MRPCSATLVMALAGAAHVADAYRFMAIGDWGASFTPPAMRREDTCAIDPRVNCSTHGVSGCGYNEQQQMDGLQMGNYAAANKVDHVMLLGDNFVSGSNIVARRCAACVANGHRERGLPPAVAQRDWAVGAGLGLSDYTLSCA